MARWYESAFRRNVIDMHIPDWDSDFLSRFDAGRYVDLLKKSGAQSAVVYAQSHVGLCNYPTVSGAFHKGLAGRDMFGDVCRLCRENDIRVVAYYSLIFNNWAVEQHPDWGMIKVDGTVSHQGIRYKHCCPNNAEYRAFVRRQVEEICHGYEFDGVRFDMTFWPVVCYCPSCRERYRRETGRERMPETIDWFDPVWAEFQEKREEWLRDFAAMATDTVRRLRPRASVEHQISPTTQNWVFGCTTAMAGTVDFMQGDFYGDEMQAMFVNKLLANYTPHPMYGFETSANRSLSDHTSLKSGSLLHTKLSVAMANGGAFVFIDTIDPVGTIRERVYDVMGDVFRRSEGYIPYLGGRRCEDVGVYFSTHSKLSFDTNGQWVGDINDKLAWESSLNMPHLDAAMGAAKALSQNHIPFGVICKANLARLREYAVIVLPNVLVMDEGEVAAFRQYVKDGGRLYASKYTSLVRKDGYVCDDFMLADLFGLSYAGATVESFTYVAPVDTPESAALLAESSAQYPLAISDGQLRVACSGGEVLATTTLPYTDPDDCERFASIHSHPPGKPTELPALVRNRFHRGEVVYSTGALESFAQCEGTFVRIIRSLAGRPFAFESETHPSVDINLFRHGDTHNTLRLVSFQKTMPNLPVHNVTVRICLGGRKLRSVCALPERTPLEWEVCGDSAEIRIPTVDTFFMAEIQFGQEES